MQKYQESTKSEIQQVMPKKKGINVFVLLFSVLVVATILTHIIPAGEYSRIIENGRSIVKPGTFKLETSAPVDLFGLATSIPKGMVEAGEIIFYILIIGGTFGVISATGAIEALIITLSRKLANNEKWLIPIMMLFFAAGGSLIGMSEETLIYIPIMIPLALALGFDVITGAAIVLVGASIGFTTAIMNPFTVGIAQGIAKLPLFSGAGFRIILFIIMYVIGVVFVSRYAMKVKKDRSYGFFRDDMSENMSVSNLDVRLEKTHKIVLLCFLLNFVVLAFGVIKYGWFITEIAGLFIILTIIIGFAGKLSANRTVESFINGASGIISGALIIGLARAIVVVLNEGHIIDTILFYASSALHHFPTSLSSVGMFFLQAIIHFIVPSGSGQAALTMPIMAPLADMLGITRQTAVLSFSLADGIGNIIFPTSGYFMAGLALAGIPWSRWAKWILPLIVIQYAIGIIAVYIANMINYGPF